MKEKVLAAYLVVLAIVICSIPIYAINYHSDTTVEDAISSKVTGVAAIIEDNQHVHEEFSISDLALDYLSTDSRVAVMTSSGIKHYNGSGANVTHCHVHIYLQCYNNDISGVHYGLSCSVIDPVLDNGPCLPFANSDITIETEVDMDSLLHSKMTDPESGLSLDLDTYNTLIMILNYYSGADDHDNYLEDPLADSGISHSFTITGPHFTLL